ncbi:MAG TPA: tryptophan--tRNA ligase [Candidatus Nanoarchaeia archaeon]|nr:tryptophan--tRNA ligase [Candidatus Nanoarchaeia archaeon]
MTTKPHFIVTPWEVKGDIDYDKLIQQFGTRPITPELLKRIEKHTKEIHPYLRRNIFFCHRDMDWLLDEYEKGNKFYLYTGRGPSENVHLGHLTVWKFTKWLQDKFDVPLYFQLTDDEKFLFKPNLTLEQTNKMAYENALDLIALGFDPKKTFIFTNTDYGKTLYREAIKVAKRLTLSTVKAAFGFQEDNNVGQYFYTAMQAVPCFLPSILNKKNTPCLIPLAIDQDPHFRITRDIMPKLGYYKPAILHQRFLPALQGGGKMSSSEGVTIFTTDSPEEVTRKINKHAFSGGQATVEEQRKKGGNPDIDASYQWLRFFEEDDTKLKKAYDDYRSGRLLSGELKAILIEKINTLLKDHQKKRDKARDQLDKFILKD